MSKVLFAPAISLMSKLSFPMKFGLVCALFAIPLTITSVQSVLDQQEQLEMRKNELKGIAHIQAFQSILGDIEHFRDLSVINRARSNSKIVGYLSNLKEDLNRSLTQYIEHTTLPKHPVLKSDAGKLLAQIDNFQSSTGSEADYIYNVFDNVDDLALRAYKFQQTIAKEYGLLSGEDPTATQIINLLTDDFRPLMRELGKARAYGTYFLSVTVLDSVGITLIEDAYQDLGTVKNTLSQRLSLLKLNDPINPFNQSLEDRELIKVEGVRYLVEEQILMDPDLVTPWEDYYLSVSDTISDTNHLRSDMVDWLEVHYRFKLDALTQQRNIYVAALSTLIFIFGYLYYGFYLAFRNGFNDLSSAAKKVAQGSLDSPVPKRSNDELGQLSDLLDTMRIQLKEREQDLLRLATTDALTEVSNRLYFNDSIHTHIERVQEHKSPLSLLLIDIDHFKKLNDSYGHLAGDYCLKEVATCLSQSLERQQDEVARYGGEEFAVILPATGVDGAFKIAQLLCDRIRALSLVFDGQTISTTISIGVASTSDFTQCKEDELLTRADQALYLAKENGRDRWEHINPDKTENSVGARK